MNTEKENIKDTQHRKYALTINQPFEKGYTHEKINELLQNHFKSIRYYCFAEEMGNKHHIHIYINFSSPVRFSQIKKYFKEAHIEQAYGTSSQNRDYVRKEGKWLKSNKKETSILNTFEEWRRNAI